MTNDIRCRSGLNIVRDSEVTCGRVPHCTVLNVRYVCLMARLENTAY